MTIITITKDGNHEVYRFLVDVIKAHPEFSETYLKRLKFPFVYKGWRFKKTEL